MHGVSKNKYKLGRIQRESKKEPIDLKNHNFWVTWLKIRRKLNSNRMNSNIKLYFRYLNCKCLKIAIEKWRKISSSNFMASTNILIFLTKIRIHPNLSILNPILKIFFIIQLTRCPKISLKMIKINEIHSKKIFVNSQNGLKCKVSKSPLKLQIPIL